MLGIKVKSAVKCHMFTPPRLPESLPPLLKKILEEALLFILGDKQCFCKIGLKYCSTTLQSS